MRTAVILSLFSLFLLFISAGANACTYTSEADKEVEEGEVAQYQIIVRNTDLPPSSIDVRVVVVQNISSFTVDPVEFSLLYLESETVIVRVYTVGVDEGVIPTAIQFYVKATGEDEHRDHTTHHQTTITHTDDSGTTYDSSSNHSGSFILIVAGGFSLLGMVGAAYHYKQYGSLPFLASYTRLDRHSALEHPLRASIYEHLSCCEDGAFLGELVTYMGLGTRNKTSVFYHLRKLQVVKLVKQERKIYKVISRSKSATEKEGRW